MELIQCIQLKTKTSNSSSVCRSQQIQITHTSFPANHHLLEIVKSNCLLFSKQLANCSKDTMTTMATMTTMTTTTMTTHYFIFCIRVICPFLPRISIFSFCPNRWFMWWLWWPPLFCCWLGPSLGGYGGYSRYGGYGGLYWRGGLYCCCDCCCCYC